MSGRRTSRRPAALLLTLTLALATAGCSLGGSTAAPVLGDATTTTATKAAGSPGPAPTCGDPTASLRPAGPLPAPGQMPAGSFMAQVQQKGRLVVGVDQTTLLFGYFNPVSGKIEGFDIDVLHQVAQAIFGDPDKLEMKAITSAQRIPYTVDKTVDIVADTMTINCARRQQVEFSSVYYRAQQKVLVPTSSTAQGLQDLGGKRVCAAAGSTSIDNIKRIQPKATAVEVADWTDCLVDLQQGRVDAVSTDDTILAGLAFQDPYVKIVGPGVTDEPYGMAINKEHPEFVRFVNAVLDRMRSDGTWARLYAKWLSRLGPAPAPPAAAYRD